MGVARHRRAAAPEGRPPAGGRARAHPRRGVAASGGRWGARFRAGGAKGLLHCLSAKIDPAMPDTDVTPEYLVDNVWLVGSPADVERKIRDMYHAVGGFGVLLAMAHEWQPKARWVQSMTLLAHEVMPKLADLG